MVNPKIQAASQRQMHQQEEPIIGSQELLPKQNTVNTIQNVSTLEQSLNQYPIASSDDERETPV